MKAGKKDFRRLAAVLRKRWGEIPAVRAGLVSSEIPVWAALAAKEFFEEGNPRFDSNKFYAELYPMFLEKVDE
jgi:hypothetical protein